MRDPQRDVPRVILLSGVRHRRRLRARRALGILLAVPLGKLSIVTGTWDALAVLGGEWGAAGKTGVLLLGIGFLYACIANIVTWSLGVNRVAAVAAEEGVLPAGARPAPPALPDAPRRLRRDGLSSSTALLVGNALLSDSQSNVFWMTFKLSALCLLLCYLLVFPAFLVLRRRRARPAAPVPRPGERRCRVRSPIVCTSLHRGRERALLRPVAHEPGAR